MTNKNELSEMGTKIWGRDPQKRTTINEWEKLVLLQSVSS